MTKSILNDCLLIRDQPLEKMQEYFKSIGCTIFDTILSRQAVPGKDSILEFEPKNTVLYILAAFSEDSPLILLRMDDMGNKLSICEYLGIPECFRHNLINLVDTEVRYAAVEYMQQFCGIEFSAWMRMKIQYNDLDIAVTNKDFKKTDKDGITSPDMKSMGDAVKQMHYLSKEIARLDKEFKSQNKLYEGIDEMRKWKTGGNKRKSAIPNSNRSLRLESNPHIE